MNKSVILMLICFARDADINSLSNPFLFFWYNYHFVSAPKLKGSGESGILYLAEPLDACTALTNKAEQLSNVSAPFVLIVRGGCSFEEKVTRAQKAGFKSAIVYDNEDDGVLVASNEQFLHVATV